MQPEVNRETKGENRDNTSNTHPAQPVQNTKNIKGMKLPHTKLNTLLQADLNNCRNSQGEQQKLL